jgi:Flp pilus assembly protein TadD
LHQKKPAAARARIDAPSRHIKRHHGVVGSAHLRATGDDAAAERMLKQVLSTDPNDSRRTQLASRIRQRGRRAIVEFDKSAALQPRAVEPRTAAGILLHVKGDLTGAQARYTKALEIDRTSPVAANNLAQLYVDRNENLDVALQLAQTAKAGLPNTHEVDDTLGWVYYKKGNGSMAVTSLRQAVKAQPNNAVYQYHLGAALALNKDRINARQALDKALKLQSNFPGADDARKILDTLK